MSIARLRSLVVVSVLASLTSAVVSAGVVHFLGMTLNGEEQARLEWPSGGFWYEPQPMYTDQSTSEITVEQGQTWSDGSTIGVGVPPSPVPPGPSSLPPYVEPPSPGDGGIGDGGSNGSLGNLDPSCYDGIDNDRDGATDGNDVKCFAGGQGEYGMPGPIGIGIGGINTSAGTLPPGCDDGIDNDRDGYADGADEKCDVGGLGEMSGGHPGQTWPSPVVGETLPVHGAAPSFPAPVDTAPSVIDIVADSIEQALKVVADYFGGGVIAPTTEDAAFGGEQEPDLPPPSDPIILIQKIDAVESDVQSKFKKVISMLPKIFELLRIAMVPIGSDLVQAANDLYVHWTKITANCRNNDGACDDAITDAFGTVNQFDSLLDKVVGEQDPGVQMWIKSATEQIEQQSL